MKKPSGHQLAVPMSINRLQVRRPVVTPGSGNAEMVAEFSWLNCSIAAGDALLDDFHNRRQRHHLLRIALLHEVLSPSFSGLDRDNPAAPAG